MSPHAREIELAGIPMRLRLTVGRLAQLARCLDCDGPAALSVRLRGADQEVWNIVLAVVADPAPKHPLTKSELSAVLPALSALIVEAFV